MTDTTNIARAHYSKTGLTETIRAALLTIAPEHQPLAIADLAPMDHFHTRGVAATRDLAELASIGPNTRVLDLGCGIGGPARFLATTYGCRVTGVDLSESFIDAASYLARRCGMAEQVDFRIGDALHLPFDDGEFDLVFLQHVAMNIADRAGLYASIARVLAPRGQLAVYDVTRKEGDAHYPTPWASEASASFLLTEAETRQALVSAGFTPVHWRDESDVARAWFVSLRTAGAPPGPTLAVVLGPDFARLTGNLARNVAEGRVGILSALMRRG